MRESLSLADCLNVQSSLRTIAYIRAGVAQDGLRTCFNELACIHHANAIAVLPTSAKSWEISSNAISRSHSRLSSCNIWQQPSHPNSWWVHQQQSAWVEEEGKSDRTVPHSPTKLVRDSSDWQESWILEL